MKKIAVFFSVVAIAAVTLVSCSKKGDYTCTCKDSSGKEVGKGTYPDTKKSVAEDACNLMKTTLAGTGITCSLD